MLFFLQTAFDQKYIILQFLQFTKNETGKQKLYTDSPLFLAFNKLIKLYNNNDNNNSNNNKM